jgi:hypothetical protein
MVVKFDQPASLYQLKVPRGCIGENQVLYGMQCKFERF